MLFRLTIILATGTLFLNPIVGQLNAEGSVSGGAGDVQIDAECQAATPETITDDLKAKCCVNFDANSGLDAENQLQAMLAMICGDGPRDSQHWVDSDVWFDFRPEYKSNDYLSVNGTDNRYCGERDCTFTWAQDVNEKSKIWFSYVVRADWNVIEEIKWDDYVTPCDASESEEGTRIHDAWRLLTYLTAEGAEGCPISAGTYKMPEKFDFQFSSGPLPCGDQVGFELQLFVHGNPYTPWGKLVVNREIPKVGTMCKEW